MIGAGTIINPIIKVVTTVAILGAVYLFFVKPALDTTEDLTDRAFQGIPNAERIFEGIPNSADIQEQIRESLEGSSSATGNKLLRCVQRANQNVKRIQRCTERFGP